MFLQYKKVGRWKDYLFGERIYIVLSLLAKTALAWMIFAGTLAAGLGLEIAEPFRVEGRLRPEKLHVRFTGERRQLVARWYPGVIR
jgi:hypothetical protein